jgi:hypothetical protein
VPTRTIRLISAVSIGCAVALCFGAYRITAQRRAPVTVTRLFTGPDGQTHAEQVDMKLTPPAVPDGTERSDRVTVTALQIVRWPPGHVNDWHNASETPGGHQYVFTISGRGEVEVAGGQKLLLEPGRILLGEDLTGKGHITRTLGSEDWVSLHVSIADR